MQAIRNDETKSHLRYDDLLEIPIIDNTRLEADLRDSMADAMRKYPTCPAVLVRRHGIYVWGPTWQSAKTQTESLDYLFEIAIKMRQLGLDPAAAPTTTAKEVSGRDTA